MAVGRSRDERLVAHCAGAGRARRAPDVETAGSSWETPAEAVGQTPASGAGGPAGGAPAEPTSPPEPEAEGAPVVSSTPDLAPTREPAAPNTQRATPAFDATDNAEWESRHAADRVPAATKPPGFRPLDRGVGWFQQSRERVRRRRSALWERVAEMRGRGPELRSRGRESLGEEGERSGSAGTSWEVFEGEAGRPTPP